MSAENPVEPTPAESPEADPATDGATAVEPTSPAPSPDVAQLPRRVWLLAILAAVIVVFDLITKIIAVETLDPFAAPEDQPRILGGAVYFSMIRNSGAAFSMATGMTWLLSLIVIGVIIFIVRLAGRLRSKPWAIGLGLVLGGAVGNLIDRIFRAPGFLQGHVVDFVSVFGPNAEHFPVFNVADSAITIGGLLVVLTALSGTDYDGTRTKDASSRKNKSEVEPVIQASSDISSDKQENI